MSYCPSQDWDRYIAGEESAAFAQFVGEIHDFARHIYLHRSTENDTIRPQDAYRMAMEFLMAQADFDEAVSGIRIRTQKGERTWANDLLQRFSDLMP